MSGPVHRLSTGVADFYVVERELGRGANATVYLARDRKHGREVALKVLRPDLAAALGAERFVREIRLLAQLQHPHILPLYDSGEVGGALYYVMPRVQGESLRERLVREGPLPVHETVAIAVDVAEALAYAHSRNVVHRDIKPENIMLSGYPPKAASGGRGGGQVFALVADFGIARAISRAGGERTTESGTAVGTPAYMSPEQASGDPLLDGRADQYALACVVYEMLVGATPFKGSTTQSMIAQRFTEKPRRIREHRPEVPANVDEAVARALSPVPDDRFPTATEFAAALAIPSHPSSAESRWRRWIAGWLQRRNTGET